VPSSSHTYIALAQYSDQSLIQFIHLIHALARGNMKQTVLRQIYRSSIAFITTALLASSMVLPQTALATEKVETHADAAPSIFWLGEYFNNATLSGSPVFRRNTRSIAFNWGTGSPSRAIPRDNFSVRWTRTFNLPAGTYRFRSVSDDGVRVWVDNTPVIDAWADGPARVQEADVTLVGLHTVRVEYYERTSVASIRLTIGLVTTAPPDAPSGNSWRAEYFNNLTLEGSPSLVRQDAVVNFDWGTGSPNPQIIADGFSARWTRKLNGVIPGYYNIGLRVDDGARVFVDGNLVVNEWRDGAPRNVGANVYLTDGSTMRVEYYDHSGGALIQLSIFPASAPAPTPVLVPSATPVPASFPNFRAEFYNNTDLNGAPVLVRNDIAVDFDWGTGSPDPRVQADNFSARWTGRTTLTPGTYRIAVRVDDGVRIYINGQIILNEWRDGPPRNVNADFSVDSSSQEMRVEYFDRGGSALIQIVIMPAFPTTFTDWKAEYFSSPDLSGTPVLVRNDTSINFDWGTGAPDVRLSSDLFSVRWTRRQNFSGGVYRIEATMDDGMRVFVDGNLVLNEWRDASARTRTVDVAIGAGDHDLRVEFYERVVSAVAKFSINRAPVTVTPTATPVQTPVPTITPIQVVVPSPTLTPIP
jgi:hypothetical protein